MQIIDFHVHPFRTPDKCLNFYPEMPALDALGMKAQLEAAGIGRICGSVLYKKHPGGWESLHELNREALALRDVLGDFYVPGFHVHPAYPEESIAEIEFMHAQGVRLIGELVPYMHGWGDFSEKNFMKILDAAEAHSMLVSYHTPFAYDMSRAIEAHPGIAFIAAHPGDHDRVGEHIALMKRYDNLYLDLSGTGMFRFGLVKHLVQEVGADRILFGTDYPICNPRMYVQAVYGEDVPDSAREKILGGNAKRLLL